MFLPNTDSFTLIRKTVVEPRKFSVLTFLPNTDSFILVSKTTVRTNSVLETVDMVDNTLLQPAEPVELTESVDQEQEPVSDEGRRKFLKVAGVVGAGVIASQFSPKKASALIMGSSPTTGVVGVKDATNARINPATEETASSLLKTSDLTFDAGALSVKVTSVSGDGSSSFSDSGDVAKSALVDGDRHVQVDVLSSTLPSSASTETTLQTISFGGYKFTLRLATVGSVDYVGEASIGTTTSAASWRIKKVDSTSGIVLQWAGTGVFDQVWDNYASLSYS